MVCTTCLYCRIIDICIPKMNTAFFIKCCLYLWKESWLMFISKKSVSKMSGREMFWQRNLGMAEGQKIWRGTLVKGCLLSDIGRHAPSMPLRSSACPEIWESLDIKLLISSLEKVQELVEFKRITSKTVPTQSCRILAVLAWAQP